MSFGSCLYSALLVIWCLQTVKSTTLPETKGVPLGKPTHLTVEDLEPSSLHGVVVTLSWREPAGSNASLTYYVRYAPEGGRTTQKAVSISRAVLKLSPNTWYSIRVMAVTADRHGPWSDTIRLWTNESVPSMPPLNVTVTSNDTSSIRVTWEPIPLQYRHAQLQGYTVFYRLSSTKRWSRKVVTATTMHVRISGLQAGARYLVAVAGFTGKGAGRKSPHATVDIKGEKAITPTAVSTPPQETHSTLVSTTATTVTKVIVHVATNLTDDDRGSPPPTTSHANADTPVIVHVATYAADGNRTSPPTTSHANDVAAVRAGPVTNSLFPGVVFKVILPAAGGGLVLVLLVVCLLWRRRRKRLRYERQCGGEEAIGLQALTDKRHTEKHKDSVVRRGEGSIRYAPPSCSSTQTSASAGGDPSHVALPEEADVSETSPMLKECSESRPNDDERYVKQVPLAAAPVVENTCDPSIVYAVPFAQPREPPITPKAPNPGYENLPHVYESLDKPDEQDKHVYANMCSNEAPEGVYAEIPLDIPVPNAESSESYIKPLMT